jgi:hypothetical protein
VNKATNEASNGFGIWSSQRREHAGVGGEAWRTC